MRLDAYNDLTASVCITNQSEWIRCGAFRHVLLPGRLHRWKRVDLAIAGMRHVKSKIELIIPGSGKMPSGSVQWRPAISASVFPAE